MYRAIVVDFDGTLLDSFTFSLKFLERLAEQNDLVFTPEIRKRIVHTWGEVGTKLLQDAFDINEERAKHMYLMWERTELGDQIPFIEGSHKALEWLYNNGFALCMLTSRRRETLIPLLERAQLQKFFMHITAHEDSDYHKPDPRAFADILKTLARWQVTEKECLFVGDTFVDMEAGKNAGIKTIVVETGPYRREHFRAHLVPENSIIASIKYLPAWIESTQKSYGD